VPNSIGVLSTIPPNATWPAGVVTTRLSGHAVTCEVRQRSGLTVFLQGTAAHLMTYRIFRELE
jgi:hypothetical protein